MSATGFSRLTTSVICGPAKAVLRYSAWAPSFEHATVASMKPRWLRIMIATPSPSLTPASESECASAFVRRWTSLEGQRPELVDDRRPVGVADGRGGVAGGRRRPPAAHGVGDAQGLVGTRRAQDAGLGERARGEELLGDLGQDVHHPESYGNRRSAGASPRLDERVDVAGPPRVEEDMALADARLLGQQAGGEQGLAHRLGQRALVAGEAAREMGELRVVSAPFPHPVQALEDAPRHPPGGVGVVVRARETGPARPRVERRQDGVLVLLHGGGVGGAPAQGRDVGGDHERVRGADRRAQVVDVGQDARGHGQRAGAQAVDALDLGLEGERHELGVVGVARDVEGELPAQVARAHGARPGHLDQRADERGDQQPGALVDGVGIGAERGRGRRHGAQRARARGRRRPARAARSPSASGPARGPRGRARLRAAPSGARCSPPRGSPSRDRP